MLALFGVFTTLYSSKFISSPSPRIGNYKEIFFLNVEICVKTLYKLVCTPCPNKDVILQVVKMLLEQRETKLLKVLTHYLQLSQSLKNPTTKLYLDFLNFMMPYVNALNNEMLSESR